MRRTMSVNDSSVDLSTHPAAAPKKGSRKWTIEDASELYNIEGWGHNYFRINENGNLTIVPEGLGGPEIQLLDVIQEIKSQGLELPCIIRFQDVLRHRVEAINKSFARAIEENSYEAGYRGVYPIKVNQMKEVIEEIVDAGRPYDFGLEAGSKAELQVVLAYNTNPEALTICNGYKDKDYIRLALLGRKLGRKVVIVIEKFSELKQCLQAAREEGVEPILGIRGKLASKGAGKWETSGGELAKFGLSTKEILQAIEYLRSEDMLHCLQLFHFHIGSQITNIRTIKEAVVEGARFYAQLSKLGAAIKYLDVGGGLGIDYDGSQSSTDFSINYTMQEYINDVVHQVKSVCEEEEVPHPVLVSESGRAAVAPHSCLVMNVIDWIIPSDKSSWRDSSSIELSDDVREAVDLIKNINLRNALESYHDAMSLKERAISKFKLGAIGLEERAVVEEIVTELRRWITKNMKRMKRIPDEFYQVQENTFAQYVVNFSVFQSAPDHWALDQLFPIVPLHRMNERPRMKGILVDITCDSDGEIDRFIDQDQEYAKWLQLHQLQKGRPYYLGMFLTGAYQDIMGDMHNLFGRVNEVHVFSDDDDPNDFYIEEVIRGDTISSILGSNQYSLTELTRMIKAQVDQQIKAGKIKPREGIRLVEFYSRIMRGYTYLNH